MMKNLPDWGLKLGVEVEKSIKCLPSSFNHLKSENEKKIRRSCTNFQILNFEKRTKCSH